MLWQARKNRISTNAILSFIAVVLIIGVVFSSLIVDRITSDDNQSAESRLWIDQLAINVIQNNMFAGVGANNQQVIYENNDDIPYELKGREKNEIHNTYLATWVELGVFGFLAFVWMLMAAGWQAFSTLRVSRNRYSSIAIAGFLGALAYFMLHMLVGTFTGRRPQFLWLIFALIDVTSMLANQTPDVERRGI